MFTPKKYITFFFLFALLLPMAIQVAHAFEEHEHVVCISKSVKHLHELENDCGDLHLQLSVFKYNFNDPNSLLNEFDYKNIIISKSKQLITNYSSKKASRAPPIVII